VRPKRGLPFPVRLREVLGAAACMARRLCLAVGNLLSAWTGCAGCFRIRAGAVAGHDLDGWVFFKPSGNDRHVSAFKDFDRTGRLQDDDHGPVAVTTLDCPVIDSNDDRRASRLVTPGAAQFAQHGVAWCSRQA